jgi:hypothetical protein
MKVSAIGIGTCFLDNRHLSSGSTGFEAGCPELYLTQSLLRSAGFGYDEIEERWVVRVPLRPLVAIECDEDRAYIRAALMEVQASLTAIDCVYNNFVVNTRFVSIEGPIPAIMP